MARTAEITFKEFRRRYNTEDACRAELFRLRFPNGFVCPKCGCVEYYPVHGRNIYQCRSCRHQTSVTAGTVMHRTHLPLTLWFWAIYLCATDKRGISAVQLSRTLGICYDSAWHLLDRIRTAMGQRDEKYLLSGIVELDDGYVGGPSHNGKRGRGTDKAKIVVAVSKTANSAPLFARMKVVDNVQGKALQSGARAPCRGAACDGGGLRAARPTDALQEADAASGTGGCRTMQKRRLSQVGVEAVERLNLPPETAVGVPQVELYGSRQLYMAGHRGVISYSTEEVTVSGGSMTVRIIGKDLQLAAMTDGELRLTGHIDRVELME